MKGKETIGVVLLNLGGPDSLQAVKPFLYNLFSDRGIIRFSYSFMQKPMAWLISSLRSSKTRKMYSLIGGKSPLLDITMAQAEALEKALNAEVEKIRSWEDKNLPTSQPLNFSSSQFLNLLTSQPHFRVYIGMRYWHPFIEDTVERIIQDGIKHLIVLSLYPHYSRATTGSAIAEFKRAIAGVRGQGSGMRIKYIEQWYDFPTYIEALVELIVKGIETFIDSRDGCPTTTTNNGSTSVGQVYRLSERTFDINILYSAHSLPERLIKEGDPYLEHIKQTVTAVNSLLITHYSLLFRWHLSFQSKSGPVKWLKPTTEETIIKLAKTGVKNLLVVPISFVSDNIETLYEIDILYKDIAQKHGINFKRCESLNTSEKFIEALSDIVIKNAKTLGWI